MPNTTPQNASDLSKKLDKLIKEAKEESTIFDQKIGKLKASLNTKADKLEESVKKMNRESDVIEESAAEKLDANSVKFVEKVDKFNADEI